MLPSVPSPRLREFLHQGSISDLLLRKSRTIYDVHSSDSLSCVIKVGMKLPN
jgi:hypothetical protein